MDESHLYKADRWKICYFLQHHLHELSSRLSAPRLPFRTNIYLRHDSILFLLLYPHYLDSVYLLLVFKPKRFGKIIFLKLQCGAECKRDELQWTDYLSLPGVIAWGRLIHSLDEFFSFFKLSKCADRIDKLKAIFHNDLKGFAFLGNHLLNRKRWI